MKSTVDPHRVSRTRINGVFVLFVLFVSLVGVIPAHAGSAATAEYARQVSTAQVRLAQLEALLVESELRIEQLEEVIREQGKTHADRLENLDQVNAEVVQLRGAIEVLQFDVAEVKRAVSEQQLASERRQLHAEMRLAQIEKFLSLKPPPPPITQDSGSSSGSTLPGPKPPGPGSVGTGTQGNAPPVDLPSNMPDSAVGKLEAAATQMAAGHQVVARAILKAAIDAHPNAAEMDEIRYRYAETFFNESDWRGAISEFNKVINNHPNSPWKCWSFYRQGESFDRMGQLDSARAFYKGATESNCKSSDAAKEAKKKL